MLYKPKINLFLKIKTLIFMSHNYRNNLRYYLVQIFLKFTFSLKTIVPDIKKVQTLNSDIELKSSLSFSIAWIQGFSPHPSLA